MILLITEAIIAMKGAKLAALYRFPLIKAIEMINFTDVIQHLEILSVFAFAFIFVGFIKISISPMLLLLV